MPEVDKDMAWFEDLQDYGELEGRSMMEDDEDQDLVPRVVMSAAMPLATDAIRNEWSPHSTSATKQARRLYRELSSFVEPSNDEMKDLLREMRDRFAAAADEAVLPMSAEATALGARLFGRCCKLLTHIGMLDGIIVTHALQRIAFEKLIDRLLLPHIEKLADKAEAKRRAQMMCDALPTQWFAPGIDMSEKVRPLVQLVQRLDGEQLDGVVSAAQDAGNWERALRIRFE